MRAVIQRVDRASVVVGDEAVGSIDEGLLVLLGVTHSDTDADVVALGSKLVDLRVFADDHGRFNRSLRDTGGAMLVVSQFTLYGDVRKGRRPSFTRAAPAEIAEPLVESFARWVVGQGFDVAAGRFGAMMEVESVNNGPFTLMIETIEGRVVGTQSSPAST